MIFLIAILLLLTDGAFAENEAKVDSLVSSSGAILVVKTYEVCHDSVSMPYFGPEFENTVNWVRVENKLPKREPIGGNLFGVYNTGLVYSEFEEWQNPMPPFIDIWGRQWFEHADEDSWSIISDAGHSWELCRVDPDTTGVMESPRFPRFSLKKDGVELTEFVGAEATRPAIAAAWLHGEDCIIEYRFSDYDDSPKTAPAEVFYYVLLNGEDQAVPLDYDKAYHVNFFDDKRFFFFQKDGKWGLNFDGDQLLTDYDLFFHDQCCSPAMWNPCYLTDGFELYAHRKSHWYLIVGTVQ